MRTAHAFKGDAAHATSRTSALSVFLRIAMVVLLLGCLAKMPYGYYQFVRFAAFVVFGLLAFQYFGKDKIISAIFFGCLSVLFQPFFKIALGRTLWNVVDVIVAVILLASIITEIKFRKI